MRRSQGSPRGSIDRAFSDTSVGTWFYETFMYPHIRMCTVQLWHAACGEENTGLQNGALDSEPSRASDLGEAGKIPGGTHSGKEVASREVLIYP